MPRWGLNRELIQDRPWTLDPRLLAPDKTNTDPIHGEVYLNRLERLIIDSPGFQRLRRVRQLGLTHLVYPSAVHSRYSHSLGALRVAQDLFDHLLDDPVSERLSDDLLSEWRAEDAGTFRRKVGESLVLARLGALLHDFCHVPFGHTIEDDFELLVPHDKNVERFDHLWKTLPDEAQQAVSGPLFQELRAIILSKTAGPQSKYPFVHDVVGNTICADSIDYLWRDYFFTGLPGKLGTRFFSSFYATRSDTPDHPEKMALRIAKNGRLRLDVITEVLKYLRYRYELGERVLQHHAKVAADTMVAKALSIWIEQRGVEAVEKSLRSYGDDGVSERLAEEGLPGASDLAAAVRDRQLFKEARHSRRGATYMRREALFEMMKSSQARKRVEERAARAVGLPHPWYVLLSIPNPRMRLKAADVLVFDGEVVTPLREWDQLHGHHASEIYKSHEQLWSVQLFVHPGVSEADRNRVAAYVQDDLKIKWDDAEPVGGLGAVDDLAISEVIREGGFGDDEREQLQMAVHRAADDPAESFAQRKARYQRLVGDGDKARHRKSAATKRNQGGGKPSGNGEQGSLV